MESFSGLKFIIVVVVAIIILLTQVVKRLFEFERGVLFRLGQLVGVRGPGWVFIIPVIDTLVKVNLKTAQIGEAITDISSTGIVRVNGQNRQAHNVAKPIRKGEEVVVVWDSGDNLWIMRKEVPGYAKKSR